MDNSVIELGQVITALQPIIITVLGAIWTAASPFIIAKIQAKLRFSITQDQWNVVHSAAQVAAREVWARAEPSIMHAQIDVRYPGIANAAKIAAYRIPEVMRILNITQDDLKEQLESLIVAQMGQLQATAMAGNDGPKTGEKNV